MKNFSLDVRVVNVRLVSNDELSGVKTIPHLSGRPKQPLLELRVNTKVWTVLNEMYQLSQLPGVHTLERTVEVATDLVEITRCSEYLWDISLPRTKLSSNYCSIEVQPDCVVFETNVHLPKVVISRQDFKDLLDGIFDTIMFEQPSFQNKVRCKGTGFQPTPFNVPGLPVGFQAYLINPFDIVVTDGEYMVPLNATHFQKTPTPTWMYSKENDAWSYFSYLPGDVRGSFSNFICSLRPLVKSAYAMK